MDDKKTILLMDDDILFRTELAGYLLRHGFNVTCCGTAAEAKEHLAQEPVDLVISDIFVKSGESYIADGGVSLLGWMQTRYKVPIIAITGIVDSQGGGFLQNMRDLGADACLAKPLDREALLTHVHELTGVKASQA